uniref:Uncharacterized protein n=1 Tax=Aegilops tauschii subsp. strangulata TaxID=200361 RepID=A0A453GC11_AEGTS
KKSLIFLSRSGTVLTASDRPALPGTPLHQPSFPLSPPPPFRAVHIPRRKHGCRCFCSDAAALFPVNNNTHSPPVYVPFARPPKNSCSLPPQSPSSLHLPHTRGWSIVRRDSLFGFQEVCAGETPEMGSCASVHKEDVELPKKQQLLAPSPPSKDGTPVGDVLVDLKRKIEGFGPGGRTPDSGSKDEMFFESQPWLDSDCEDDFYSINGGFHSVPRQHSGPSTQGADRDEQRVST